MCPSDEDAALSAIQAADDEDTAFEVLTRYAKSMGAEMVAYHHLAPVYAERTETFTLMTSGFPDPWVDLYRRKTYRRIDPIAAFVRGQTRPVLWSTVGKLIPLSPAQEEFQSDLWAWLAPGDGLSIPLFGPSGRHGSAGVARSKPLPEDWIKSWARPLQMVACHFHLRVCELRLSAQSADFELTAREQAVLRAMARGLPDPMICGVVNAQLDSVRATIESILSKMNVIDRPSALLRAKGLNLID